MEMVERDTLFSMFNRIGSFCPGQLGLLDLVVYIYFLIYFERINSLMCNRQLFTERVLAQ
jgi:hypothetical protein